MKTIIVLVDGADGLAAYFKTMHNNPNDRVIPVWYDLGLPFSKNIKDSLGNLVIQHSMTHYASKMRETSIRDTIYFDHPYEPMVWDCIGRMGADKVVIGVIATDVESVHDIKAWMNEFNTKIGKNVIEMPLLAMNKVETLTYLSHVGTGINIFATYSCRNKKPSIYGCGGCLPCVRKRGATLTLGKPSNIPPPNVNTTLELAEWMGTYIDAVKHSKITTKMEGQLEEMLPALVEAFGTDDLKEITDELYDIAWTLAGGKPHVGG